MRSLKLLVLVLAGAAPGCGQETDYSEAHRATSAAERELVARYREVVRLLKDADARALCAAATGEAALTLRCDSGSPAVPASLRSLRPDYAGLYVYPDLGATSIGAPLNGRDDRLFVRFDQSRDAAAPTIDSIATGYAG